MLFLFKQKTAYELRISDWSSDVSSSDLGPRAERLQRVEVGGQRLHVVVAQRLRHAMHHFRIAAAGARTTLVVTQLRGKVQRGEPAQVRIARKSVVSGKSVSVRVGLGGRRIINNKKHHKSNTNTD